MERRPLSVFFGPGDVLEGLGILRVRGSLDREGFENLTCLGELARVVKHVGFSLQGVVVVRGGFEDFVVVEQGLGIVARGRQGPDRKSTRLNSSHGYISYAVFCLKKKKTHHTSH